MANPLEGKTKEELIEYIYKLKLQLEIEGLDESGNAFDKWKNKLEAAEAKTGKWGKVLGEATSLLHNMQRVSAAAVGAVDALGRNFGAAGISTEKAKDILKEYNAEVIQVSASFAKYGVRVDQFQKYVDNLRTSYKLTYAESIKLASSIEKGLNYTKPQAFAKSLDMMMKGFSNNIDAVNSFKDALENLIDTRPELEKLYAAGEFGKVDESLDALVAAGKIRIKDIKGIKDGLEGIKRAQLGGTEQAAINRLYEPIARDKTVQQAFEKGMKDSAQNIYDFQEAIGITTKNMEKLSGVISKIVQGATNVNAASNAAGSVLGTVGDIGGSIYAVSKSAKYTKAAYKYATKGAAKAATKIGVKAGAKFLGKAALKAIPIAGLGVAAYFAKDRLAQGDYKGAAWEAASGIASLIPVIGTAASLSLDAGLAARDIMNANEKAGVKGAGEYKPEAAAAGGGSVQTGGGGEGRAGLAVDVQKRSDALKIVTALYEQQSKYAESITASLGKSGNFNAAISLSASQINTNLKLRADLITIIAEQEQVLAKTSLPEQRKELEEGILANKNKLLDLANKELENRKNIVNVNAPYIEQLSKQISLQESQISLLDSAGMGLKAQASARQQVVQMLRQEVAMEKDREQRGIQQKTQLLQEMEVATGDQRIKIQEGIYEQDNLILEARQKQVQATQKQADIVKSLREGYISAIQAMTSGAGVFTRIVLKQDQGLGTLAAMRRDGLNALTTGGIGGGRTSSGRFGIGGFTEGEAGAYERGVLSKIGVSAANSLQQNVSSMMNYAQRASAGMSGAMASYGQGPLGSGAFAGASSSGMTRYGGGGTASGRGGSLDTEGLRRTMVDIFSKIGQEIINETIRRLRQ
jgi:hypothetical protein